MEKTNETKHSSFKDLKIWQKGMEIVKDVYLATMKFPKDELYGLVSQLKRAASSIPSNIAEGFVRFHKKEYIQFLRVSLGSAAELETQLILSRELTYLDDIKLDEISNKLHHLTAMTITLIKKIQSDMS